MEAAEAVDSKILGSCTGPPKLIFDGGILTEDMAVTDTEHLVIGVTIIDLVFVKKQHNTTLDIIGLPLHCSNGHAKCSSEEVLNVVGGVDVFSNTQKGWT